MALTRALIVAALASAPVCGAFAQFANFDAEIEGFKGNVFTSSGITFFDANNVAGFYPDGVPFEAGENGTDLIIENATFAANDFPEFLSAKNALTFGTAFIPGDNLSLGALSNVSMTTGAVVTGVTFDMLYYENGPWGGIEVLLEAFSGGSVVGSTSFIVAGSDPTGRDNPAGAHMSLGGFAFDSVRLSARLNGEYTTIRALVDNVSFVPAPASLAMLGFAGLGMRRRR